MSGTPTEAEIQTQWRNSIDLIEQTRVYADATVAGGGGLLDTLLQALEGEYTPSELANAAQRYRAGLSSLVEPARVLEFLTPIIFEYGNILSEGSGYGDTGTLMQALYEHFVTNSLTVESRAITYDTSATLGGSNVGNGGMERLTVDENGFNLEDCYVEAKRFRCRSDQNSGSREHAEVFEHLGDTASRDSLLRSSSGSGEQANTFLSSHHAGGAGGGSLLRNGSFSTFDSTASPKFEGWTEASGGGNMTQTVVAAEIYRSHPGAGTDAALKLTGDGTQVTIKQTLASMGVSQLDPDTPYFLRVMLNKDEGTAVGGTITLKLGSQSATVTISAMGSGWQELFIGGGGLTSNWFRNFNEDPFDVELDWSSSSSGYLVVDDMIFAPWDLIDGTWWFLRGNSTTHIPWLVDDTLLFTDTGGAPATAKIQYYLWASGLGTLPSTTGTPTFTEP